MYASTKLLNLYYATHYDVRMRGGKRVTLRVGDQVPLSLIGWANDTWPLVFISACNPQSIKLPAQENRQRMNDLLERLGEMHARVLPGAGQIPGQDWREPSLLIAGLTIEGADSLAFDFDQNAILIAHKGNQIGLRIYRPKWASPAGAVSAIETQPTSQPRPDDP